MSPSTPPPSTPISISLAISTSSPTLDLSLDTPFTLTALATLHSTHAITFQKRHAPIFTRPLFTPGLTLRNTRTGNHVPRPTMHTHYIYSQADAVPTQKRTALWMTLHPRVPHVIDVTLAPRMVRVGRVHLSPGMSAKAVQELQRRQTRVRKWVHVAGLVDGEAYEIGVSAEAGLGEWFVGDLDGVLDVVEGGKVPELRKEVIRFEVAQGAGFFVERPDEDGRLSDVL